MTDSSAGADIRSPRWPWAVLALGLVWTVLIRVPLVLNAEDHLDSDLAVDGLTLIDALHGQWRWHYPGTPHMGILPLFFSYLQALIWGANAITLVSGGTLIWLLIVVATFWLALRTYGLAVAGWAILPLVFSSTGTIWLSGRITGGHLLTLAWHILAFVFLHGCLTKGGRLRSAVLGLWCGLGLYLDMMFLFTLFGLLPAAVLAWYFAGRWRIKLSTIAAFVAGAAVGFIPHEIGRMVDPYNAYPSQFAATFEASAIGEHGRLLVRHCLPRLIAGTELVEVDRLAQRNELVFGKLFQSLYEGRQPRGLPPYQEWLAVFWLTAFLAGFIRLGFEAVWARDAWGKGISLGIWISALLIVAAFLLNKNIFNSDNYRYLIFLLPPWSLGFGLLMGGLSRRGLPARATSGILVVALFWGMTFSTYSWYRDELGFLDRHWRIVRVAQLAWNEIPVSSRPTRGQAKRVAYVVAPDVTHVFGDYWDVYRMSFLSGKKIEGIPYPMYPNRFPGWSRGLGPEEGKLLALGIRRELSGRGTRKRSPAASAPLAVLDPNTAKNWRAPFGAVWQNAGRDPAEIDRLHVVVPSLDRMGR